MSTSSDYGENAAPFMLEAGISSMRQILTFWGIHTYALVTEQLATEPATEEHPETGPAPPANPPWRRAAPATGVQKTIEDALRTAGSCADIEAMSEVIGCGPKARVHREFALGGKRTSQMIVFRRASRFGQQGQFQASRPAYPSAKVIRGSSRRPGQVATIAVSPLAILVLSNARHPDNPLEVVNAAPCALNADAEGEISAAIAGFSLERRPSCGDRANPRRDPEPATGIDQHT